jgi:asparagine synthase (glutamine-hydrolysing)
MCGLVGILRKSGRAAVERDLLERMNDAIAHRGPDDSGYYLSGNVGLAHRRLSIIDLSGGHQPMRDERNARVIVYNGEAYNFADLRDCFLTDDRLATHSDTEVLLALTDFERFDWLERVNGMFAFAVWDERCRRLLLARDRLGVKPLYYAHLGDELIFASEIRSLLLHPRVTRELNIERVPEYLAYRTLGATETLFRGISQLPPGCVMVVDEDTLNPRIVEYWTEGRARDISDYVDPILSAEDQFEFLLKDAVRYRLVGDVPVGSFNSGGVDSSLVTAMMRSLTEGDLHTFSIGFEEAEYDERRYAQIVADQLGTHHHTLVATESQFANTYEKTLKHLEEPLNHANTVQLLMLSEFARQHVTVILTGEGSDEIFGGYPRLQIPMISRYASYLPAVISDSLAAVARSTRQRRLAKLFENCHDFRTSVVENARNVSREELGRLVPKADDSILRRALLERAEARSRTQLDAMLYFEQRTYLPSLLMRLDKSSMAAGLECRVPFLDYRIVEWSYRLPDHYKIRLVKSNKYIVKKVAERWLPREIVYRRKSGFGSPLAQWLRNPKGLGRYLELLSDSTARTRGIFAQQRVEQLITEHLKEGRDHSEVLWALMNFELWCRRFIDQQPWAVEACARAQVA